MTHAWSDLKWLDSMTNSFTWLEDLFKALTAEQRQGWTLQRHKKASGTKPSFSYLLKQGLIVPPVAELSTPILRRPAPPRSPRLDVRSWILPPLAMPASSELNTCLLCLKESWDILWEISDCCNGWMHWWKLGVGLEFYRWLVSDDTRFKDCGL